MHFFYVEDIKQKKDVWVIDLYEKPGRGTKKTEASERLVPIHPFLLTDLNFLGYVEQLKEEGKKQLFPELHPNEDGDYSPIVSKWFTRYRKRHRVEDPEGKKVFHSFRNTVANHLKQKGVLQEYVAALLGQTVSGIAFDTYSQDYAHDILFSEAVSKIDYGLDLSHLRHSKFVVKNKS